MTSETPPCEVSLRVWGDYLCVTRPDMKSERVSYAAPTPSAARGILEAVFYEPQMMYVIHEIGVVKKGRWFSFRRNETKKVINFGDAARAMIGGEPLAAIRAGGGGEDATQRGMLALADVEYLITAEIRLTERADPPRDNLGKYRDLFAHRASRGKCHHRPSFGCREFAADFEYVPDPSAIALCEDVWPREDLGLMLYDVFDPRERRTGESVKPNPVFFHAKVERARIDCHPDRVILLKRNVAIEPEAQP